MNTYYKCSTYENENIFVRITKYEDSEAVNVYMHCPENKDINLGIHFSSKEEALNLYNIIKNIIKNI